MSNDTLGFYADNAANYAASSSVNRKLDSFLKHVRPAGLILELGTGSGQDAKAMLACGFDVDPTDGSPELAAQASALLQRPVRQMLFHELDTEARYDGIYASASLLHAKRADLPNIVRHMHRALKPGGWLWASFKDGLGEGYDALGRYYNYMSADEIAHIWMDNAAWSAVSLESWQGSGYDQKPTLWHSVMSKR
ncbi:class I SAM-dependent methyltransferase [Ochrobactrum sp. Marseille-Q0166]|uniref:class I SAM-dependent methyltransferase n=1 Tax=Ochrobactrum sp. Marseille-Q0166 TaxID=2761105 RepID=UPI0016557A4B|nr:class I SAM-dependent methyltransferase [Ochrobactrum sp. Marseille-Q0166]MBC8717364.1 class I SAM-dependent methyltransferase [Ochrobactrum sp. Marseille-Q0166]